MTNKIKRNTKIGKNAQIKNINNHQNRNKKNNITTYIKQTKNKHKTPPNTPLTKKHNTKNTNLNTPDTKIRTPKQD